MRLLILGLTAIFLTSCKSSVKPADATADGREPAGLSRECNPNQFSGVFIDSLRKEITNKYGEDFGARCTELKAVTLGQVKPMTKKERARAKKKTGMPLTGKIKHEFAYDTEGCLEYRKEACAAATMNWINEMNKQKSDGAEAGT